MANNHIRNFFNSLEKNPVLIHSHFSFEKTILECENTAEGGGRQGGGGGHGTSVIVMGLQRPL